MPPRTTLFVGGLAPTVDSKLLLTAFIPFGSVSDVDVPQDHSKGCNKGFGFVTFADGDDAAEALFNMDGFELLSRPISVKWASEKKGGAGGKGAVWEAEDWMKEHGENTEGGGDDSTVDALKDK